MLNSIWNNSIGDAIRTGFTVCSDLLDLSRDVCSTFQITEMFSFFSDGLMVRGSWTSVPDILLRSLNRTIKEFLLNDIFQPVKKHHFKYQPRIQISKKKFKGWNFQSLLYKIIISVSTFISMDHNFAWESNLRISTQNIKPI